MAHSRAPGPQERPLWAALVPPQCSNPGHCLDRRVGRQAARVVSMQSEKDPSPPWVCWACGKAGSEREVQGWRGQTPRAGEPLA